VATRSRHDPAETHRSRGREHVPIIIGIRREAVPSRLSRCLLGQNASYPSRIHSYGVHDADSESSCPDSISPIPTSHDCRTTGRLKGNGVAAGSRNGTTETAILVGTRQPPMGAGGFDDGAFGWSKHKDVKRFSLRSDAFSSLQKTALPRTKRHSREQIRAPASSHAQHGRAAAHPSPRSSPAAHAPGRSSGCATTCAKGRQIVETAAAHGSGDFVNRCRASFRASHRRICWVCRRKTG